MTVCIATLFRWNYAKAGEPPNFRVSAILASDRMITFGDVQYEPHQLKMSMMTDRIVILVAGDYSVHTEALKLTAQQISRRTKTSPRDIALAYGRAIQGIKRRQAEDVYMAPLNMNTDTFNAQQNELSESIIQRITDQMQSYKGPEVEALVIGSEEIDVEIWRVDSNGTASDASDVGFAAIGNGAWHAQSRLMQFGYTKHRAFLSSALAATFTAKKSAEIAPGVGKETDVYLVMKDAYFELWPNVRASLESTYKEYEEKHLSLVVGAVARLEEMIQEQKESNDGKEAPIGGDSKVDERPSADAPEAPRAVESEKT